ncbi:MAG: hypothetical protein ACREMQ_06185, partial [Longimicrobiales bacterium]
RLGRILPASQHRPDPRGTRSEEKVTCRTATQGTPEPAACTQVSLSQDNNPDERARAHSEQNWSMMLGALKQFLEGSPR